MVSVFSRQACSGIPLAVGLQTRDRLDQELDGAWNTRIQTSSGREMRNSLRPVWLLVLPQVLLWLSLIWRGSLPALIYYGRTWLLGKSQSSTVGVQLQPARVVSLYYSQFYACSGSYKRGKVHPRAIPYSRTSYAYEQSRCPGSDKWSMSSSLILFNMDGPYQLRQIMQKSSRPNLKTSEGSSRHGRLNSLAQMLSKHLECQAHSLFLGLSRRIHRFNII